MSYNPNPGRDAIWRLLAAADDAGAQMCSAEAALANVGGRLHKLDAMMTRLRHLAGKLGVPLETTPRSGTPDLDPMSVPDFASKMGWGVKRMRQLVKQHMIEGEHYHRNGCRVLVHPGPASRFVERFSATHKDKGAAAATSIADEVTRFRARQALKRSAS